MAITRTITITVDPTALGNIQKENLNMVVTKNPGEGSLSDLNVIWYVVETLNIGQTNTFKWTDEYGVYVTNTQIKDWGFIKVEVVNSAPSELNKSWEVNGVQLHSSLKPPQPDAITICNKGTASANVGMTQMVEQKYSPISIIAVGQNDSVIIPAKEIITVLFVTPIDTTEDTETLLTEAVTFDMSGYTNGASTFQADGTWTSPNYS